MSVAQLTVQVLPDITVVPVQSAPETSNSVPST
eukprot:gene27260-biopygen17784